MENIKEIYLAGGCFWGVEKYFSQLKGILYTEVGFANGNIESPSYEDVCSGISGFVEVVYIKYDNNITSLDTILKNFFKIINPLSLNSQGPDIGEQYRTGIYFCDEIDFEIIKKFIDNEQLKYSKPIVTEVKKLINYYKAEDYHQKYLEKNPNGYCHIDFSLFDFNDK